MLRILQQWEWHYCKVETNNSSQCQPSTGVRGKHFLQIFGMVLIWYFVSPSHCAHDYVPSDVICFTITWPAYFILIVWIFTVIWDSNHVIYHILFTFAKLIPYYMFVSLRCIYKYASLKSLVRMLGKNFKDMLLCT